jgi:hypothetical protein
MVYLVKTLYQQKSGHQPTYLQVGFVNTSERSRDNHGTPIESGLKSSVFTSRAFAVCNGDVFLA